MQLGHGHAKMRSLTSGRNSWALWAQTVSADAEGWNQKDAEAENGFETDSKRNSISEDRNVGEARVVKMELRSKCLSRVAMVRAC